MAGELAAGGGVAMFAIVAALGMRHGVDPDHLAAIDGLSRFHPSRWNGALFAVGHCTVVMLLAVGFGAAISARVEPWQDWILVAVGLANLYRLFRPARHRHVVPGRWKASPMMLGVVFGMGFETASQISALLLAGRMNPWVVGAVFSLAMIAVDGVDGYLAARTQQMAAGGSARAARSTQWLGVLVVVFSFGVAAADWAKVGIERFALPMGLVMFTAVIGLRVWATRGTAGSARTA